MIAHMLGSGVPFLDEGHADMRIGTRGDFDAFGQTGVAIMLHHHIGVRMVGGDDDHMQGVEIETRTMHLDEHGLADVAPQFEHDGLAGRIPFDGGNAVVGFRHRSRRGGAERNLG